MTSSEERQRVAGVVIETLSRLGAEDLLDRLTIEWAPLRSRLGDATYGGVSLASSWGHGSETHRSPSPKIVRVRFSTLLWPRLTETKRTETAIHEACHLVAEHAARRAGRRIKPHGVEWQTLMLRCGVMPHATAKGIDTDGLPSKRTIEASCACKAHKITPYIAGRIAAGCPYVCNTCRGRLSVAQKVAPVAARRRKVRFQ